MPFFVSFVIFVVQAFSFWPKANKNMQFFASFAFFAVQSFFNRPLASLTQARQDRKERRKDMFIGPPGQQKKFFFASLALFAVQSFLF